MRYDEGMRPIHYKIDVIPDLDAFRFSGRVEITLELDSPSDHVLLNALELAVWKCCLVEQGQPIPCPFRCEPEAETITIFLPGTMEGQMVVRIDYEGLINNTLAGFYRSRYKSDNEVKYVAVTQFQESDARRAFPCVDRPGKKATFEVQLLIEETMTAISNTPVVEEPLAAEGKKRVRFQKTPVMSTYLVFWAIGPFDWIEDSGEVLIRVATMPGMTRYASLGLAFGRKAFEYCQDYYAVDFPLPKLDLIAIEDFAAGAMENWGAMTFRENLLLQDPKTTSRAGEQRIYEVIAHETAHQWFGDLVSPSDWRYLWLNESFATFFGFGVVDHYYPQWDVWAQFLLSETASALQRDGLLETCAIEIAGGEHVVINASTAPIIYSKGASVLRQVEGYLGREVFREGLRHYLKRHAFACASSEDLWESLAAVSDVPVSAMMESWIYEKGHPVVTVHRDGRHLSLSQERFTFLPNDSKQTWTIPIMIHVCRQNGRDTTVKVLMENSSADVDLGSDCLWYKVNKGQIGFYRVCYEDEDNLERLCMGVLDQTLSPEDRWGLQADLYAQVLTGKLSVDGYLQYLHFYEKESAFLPIAGIAGNLFHAFMVSEGKIKKNIMTTGKSFLARVLAQLGFEPEAKEPQTTAMLRDQILWQAVLFGFEQARAWAHEQFVLLMAGEEVHPDIARSVMQVGALTGDNQSFAWFDKELQASQSEHERLNILIALGSFGDRALIDEALTYALQKVPDRNKFIPICAMANNPKATGNMWNWFVDHVDELAAFHPVHFERVIAAVVPVCGLGREKSIQSFFEGYLRHNQKVRDVVALSLEKLEINKRLRGS
jgi:tricorn protease interacting factor F2/3